MKSSLLKTTHVDVYNYSAKLHPHSLDSSETISYLSDDIKSCSFHVLLTDNSAIDTAIELSAQYEYKVCFTDQSSKDISSLCYEFDTIVTVEDQSTFHRSLDLLLQVANGHSKHIAFDPTDFAYYKKYSSAHLIYGAGVDAISSMMGNQHIPAIKHPTEALLILSSDSKNVYHDIEVASQALQSSLSLEHVSVGFIKAKTNGLTEAVVLIY
jgi:hypothetical protein